MQKLTYFSFIFRSSTRPQCGSIELTLPPRSVETVVWGEEGNFNILAAEDNQPVLCKITFNSDVGARSPAAKQIAQEAVNMLEKSPEQIIAPLKLVGITSSGHPETDRVYTYHLGMGYPAGRIWLARDISRSRSYLELLCSLCESALEWLEERNKQIWAANPNPNPAPFK